METLTFEVLGMTCGGCERRVRDAVGALAGISSVVPEHIGDEVEVTFDPGLVDAGRIAAAITALGFRVAS